LPPSDLQLKKYDTTNAVLLQNPLKFFILASTKCVLQHSLICTTVPYYPRYTVSTYSMVLHTACIFTLWHPHAGTLKKV